MDEKCGCWGTSLLFAREEPPNFLPPRKINPHLPPQTGNRLWDGDIPDVFDLSSLMVVVLSKEVAVGNRCVSVEQDKFFPSPTALLIFLVSYIKTICINLI